MSFSRVLVTGAGGHIGNNLVRELLKGGKKVKAMVHSPRGEYSLKDVDVEKVRGDVRDPDFMDRVSRGVDVIYHIAGIISIMKGRYRLMYDVNVRGTLNVARVAMKYGSRLVYTSTIHIFVENEFIDESTPIVPERVFGDYAKTKSIATLKLLKMAEKGLDVVVLCPTGVVGPHDYRPSKMGRFLINTAKGRYPFFIRGGYNFVDVRDVVEAHISAARRGRSGNLYIISGHNVTMEYISSRVVELTGRRYKLYAVSTGLVRLFALLSPLYFNLTGKEPEFTEYSIHTVTSPPLISNQKARKELGYSPRPFDVTLKDTIEWFKEQGYI